MCFRGVRIINKTRHECIICWPSLPVACKNSVAETKTTLQGAPQNNSQTSIYFSFPLLLDSMCHHRQLHIKKSRKLYTNSEWNCTFCVHYRPSWNFPTGNFKKLRNESLFLGKTNCERVGLTSWVNPYYYNSFSLLYIFQHFFAILSNWRHRTIFTQLLQLYFLMWDRKGLGCLDFIDFNSLFPFFFGGGRFLLKYLLPGILFCNLTG